MTELHESVVSKMNLIQPKKFRTCETGLFKLHHLEMPRFKMAVKVTVSSEAKKSWKWKIICSPLGPTVLGWIKLFFDSADLCNFGLNELNPT